jgi:thioredoxin 1
MSFTNRSPACVLALLLCVVSAVPLRGQSVLSLAGQWKAGADAKAIAGNGFEPLDRWKAAVAAGDRAALAALYSSSPGAFTQTPQGTSTDPSEEPEFWTRLHSSGLQAINPKILEATAPQAGVVVLVLRVDITVRKGDQALQEIVSSTQVWAQQGAGWYIYRSKRSDLLPRPPIRLPEPAKPNPQLYPDPSEAHKDLEAALAVARKDHKRVLVVFGGNWCYDCHVLDTTFHSREIQPLVTAGYHVVHVNIGEYNSNLDIAQRCDVVLDKGVPALAVLDGEGHVITSQKQGEFESAVKIGIADVTRFLKQWAPNTAR